VVGPQDAQVKSYYRPVGGLGFGESSVMRCIACRAEMRVVRVEQDPAMKTAGYEHQSLECIGCGKTERGLAFSGDRASWPIESVLASLPILAAERPTVAHSLPKARQNRRGPLPRHATFSGPHFP
jgi:hypothetical protein